MKPVTIVEGQELKDTHKKLQLLIIRKIRKEWIVNTISPSLYKIRIADFWGLVGKTYYVMLQEINVSDLFVLPKERFSFVYNLKKSYVKILSTIVAVTFLSVMPSQAQGLETQSNTTGYIDCSYGVTIITQKVRLLSKTGWECYYKFGNRHLTAKLLYALDENGNDVTLLSVRVPREK